MRSRVPDPETLLGFRATVHLRRQAVEVERVWPTLSARVAGRRLVVAGEVQPGELSATYGVRVVYDYGDPPRAFVDQPALRARGDGEPIPHIYSGPRPCLFLPGAREWAEEKLIAETIIPWLMLWLLYYELWHATGEWQGGGAHPEPLVTQDGGTSDLVERPKAEGAENAAALPTPTGDKDAAEQLAASTDKQ